MLSRTDTMPELDGEAMVRLYLESGRDQDKEAVIRAFAPLVKHVVGRISLPPSAVLTRSDLYQFGMMGLLTALDRFDPELGVPFRTYAYKRIHGEVMDAIRKEGLIGRHRFDKIRRLEKTVRRVRAKLGREPLPLEVCQDLDISIDEYHDIMGTAQLGYMESLNSRVSNADGETLTRLDLLTDQRQQSPEELVTQANLKEHLKRIIAALPDRERLIIALYFTENLTMQDIGDVIGITEARVSQILNKTLLEIRTRLME